MSGVLAFYSLQLVENVFVFVFTDVSTVFVKDMAYYLVNRLDSVNSLPKNYVHTFLLRDPHKAIYSLYKMSLNTQLTGA